jgi:hypothetical protein
MADTPPEAPPRGRRFWTIVSAVFLLLWCGSSWRRALRRGPPPKLEAQVVGDTLRLRFAPSAPVAPTATRDGVAAAPLLTGGGGPETWVLRGFREGRREEVLVRLGDHSWHLATVEGQPEPVQLVEIGATAQAVLRVLRPIRARWAGGGEWRELSSGAATLPTPTHQTTVFPWILEWEDRGVSGTTPLDPVTSLARWAAQQADSSRPGRMERRWTLDADAFHSFGGPTPLDIVEPLRTAAMRAIQDPVQARRFSNFVEDWRIFRTALGAGAGEPEACWDAPPGRPGRATLRPEADPIAPIERAPEVGDVIGFMGAPFKHFVTPPGTWTQIGQLRWPAGLPDDGDLTLVIQVRPAAPGSWYTLIELRPNKRFYLIAFPPPACGKANAEGHEYLSWRVPARLAPTQDRLLYLREFRPPEVAESGELVRAWVSRAPGS